MQNWKTWFAIVVLGWGIFQAARFTEAGSGIDYLHFWIIPRSVADWDIRNIYDPQAQELILQRAEQELPEELSADGLARLNIWLDDYRQLYETGLNPTGTPFFYAVQNLPGGKDIEIGFLCFQWASTFGLIVAVGLIGAALRAPPWSWILLAGLLLAIYKPLFLDIAVANVNRFQLLQVALAIGAGLALRTRNRWLIAGLILGLAASYKPNVLLGSVALAILLVVDSRRRDGVLLMAGWLAATLVALAAGSIFMGTPAAWSDWWVYFGRIWDQPFPLESGNYSLCLLGPHPAMKPISMLLTLLLLLGLTWRLWSTRWVTDPDAPPAAQPSLAIQTRAMVAIAAGLLIPLLSGPVAWGHYFTLAIPMLVVLLLAGWELRLRLPVICGATGLVLIGLIPGLQIADVTLWVTLFSLQLGVVVLMIGGWSLLAVGQKRTNIAR